MYISKCCDKMSRTLPELGDLAFTLERPVWRSSWPPARLPGSPAWSLGLRTTLLRRPDHFWSSKCHRTCSRRRPKCRQNVVQNVRQRVSGRCRCRPVWPSGRHSGCPAWFLRLRAGFLCYLDHLWTSKCHSMCSRSRPKCRPKERQDVLHQVSGRLRGRPARPDGQLSGYPAWSLGLSADPPGLQDASWTPSGRQVDAK